MSEPLRKTLEKAVDRLYKYITEYANEIVAKKVDLNDKVAADEYLENCNHIYGKLKQTVNEVNNYKQRWERIIAQTPNPVARKAEDELFTAWSSKEQNFIDGVELAYDIMDRLEKALRKLKMETPAPQNDNLEEMDEHDEFASNTQDTGYDLIRLPQIEIPTFDGSLEQWPTFSETFMETIHKNRKLPNVLKLTHLMRCLSGDAAKVVAGYPTIGINYPIVWNALKERFGNREQLLNQLNSKLLRLPTCHSEDPRELRKAYDEMARVTRILTAQNIDCNNSQVTTIIETKLPPSVLHELYKTKHEQQIDEWTIDHLLDEINKIVTLKETVNRAMQTHRDSSYNGMRTYEKSGKTPQNVLATQHTMKTPRTPCILCGGQHWNDKCIVYKTVSSRMDRLKEMRRCFTCLQEGHMTKQCQRRAFCRACNGTHSSVLCRKTVDMDNPKMNTMEQRRAPELAYPQRQQQRTPRPHPTTGGNAAPIGQRQAQNNALTVHPVTTGVSEAEPVLDPKSSILSLHVNALTKNGETLEVLALLDTCSSISFATNELMEKCGSDIGDYLLTVNTVNGQKEIDTNKGQLQLALTAGGYETFTVHAIPKIMEKVEIVTMDENNKLIAKHEVPQLLIGIGKLLELFNSGPEKMENGNYKWTTTLGTAYGGGDTAEKIWCALTVKEEEDDMDNLEPPAHWMLTECEGDTPTDDEMAKSLFQGSLRRDKNGRYTAKLLFREPPTELPSNYKTALAVLAKTVNELTTKNALEKYNKQIWTEIEAGTTEIVTPTTRCGKQKHYLTHRGLHKDNHRTTPLRLIYNGSMRNRITKRSLNSYLLRGPIKLPKIPGCVWRFRRAKIAMIADIQKAFHQVGLDIPDRDFTRFLWLKDITKPVTPDNIMILRFTSVPFGIVTSPSLLGMTLEHHLTNHELPLARSLLPDLYVDNVFMDVENVKDGIQKYHDSKQIFRDAQMNLREYMTNDSELNKFLMEQEGHTIPEEAKFLGVNWKMTNDDISFHLTPIKPSEKVTLRKVLENISKPFDTSGLLCPALLEAKLFYQKAFATCASRGKVNWDENLTEELQKEWQSIVDNWHGSVRTPRYIPALSSKNVKVDIFTDASDKAIGAMAYISSPKSQPVLLQACQRLAPSKSKRTTPQLEVAAILEGVNLLKSMREELPELETAETTIWSDSKIALSWIKNGKCDGAYANNRVKKIRQCRNVTYHYVNTKCNPADVITRGMTTKELNGNELWQNGPALLVQRPRQEPYYVSPNEPIVVQPFICAATDATTVEPDVIGLVDSRRSSKWAKTVGTARKVLYFIEKAKGNSTTEAELQTRAIRLLIHEAQLRSPPTEQQITKNNMYEDDHGIWRCRERMDNSNLKEKDAIYLPKNDATTRLIILHCHKNEQHFGISQTLAMLQTTYWIPNGRRTVKTALKQCYVCRRLRATPFALPPMAQLPGNRVTYSDPFRHTGMDYLGPVNLRIGKERMKGYVLMFTCFSTRAVHLELVANLTAESCVDAVRRFVARRGLPSSLLSDNATTFKLAEATIAEATQAQLLSRGIQWKFIPELSPWKGGVYERLVAITKHGMRAATNRQTFEYIILYTALSEIEGSMNRRALVYVPEMEEVLTPSHFLMVPRNNTLTLDIDNDDDSTYQADSKQKLIDLWRKKMAIYSRFIQRWETEYLGFLRERSKQLRHEGRYRQSDIRPLVGDVVLLRDTEMINDPMKWPLAKVIATHGTDNYSNATIKTQHGQLLKRPVNMLYPLEMSCEDAPEMEQDSQSRMPTRSAGISAFTYLLLILMLWLQTAKAQCMNCSSCSFGGVELHYPSKLDSVKLCIYSRCFIYSEVTTDETILLPLSITSDTYTASISGWIGNEKVMANQLICEAATICELVKCRLCMDYIWNVHCDYWTAIYVGVIIVLLSGILMRVLACIGCVRCAVHWIWHCITCCRSTPAVRRRTRFFQIVVLFLVTQSAAGCLPATTFMAKSEACLIAESGLLQCAVKTSAIITTKAGQRSICLHIKDPTNDLTVFTVKVAIQQVVLRCQSNTLFYTRDHQIQTISSKRCAGAGSCTGDKCDGIKSTDHIAELQKGNDHPGYTHCEASCGCAACGCFRCDAACLFYRVYAKPTSPKLYKVSSCSVYAPIVSFNVVIEGIDNSSSIKYSSNSFEKEPGTPTTWKNITTTILTVTVPPLPILSSKFLTNLDTSATRIVETAGAGQPVSGTIGQLQCKSLEDAKTFTNCYFPPNTCNCDMRQDTADCICPRIRI